VSYKVMESRVTRRFAKLAGQDRAGLVAFITANDPSPGLYRSILEGLPAAGVDLIEIGMPFSDPMADGPSIQLSSQRALKAGVTMSDIFSSVAGLREWDMDIPVILMGYYNPIYSYGVDRFCADAAAAGVDGVIVVDMPPEEAPELLHHLKPNGLHFIFLTAPTTSDTRLPAVLEHASGFLYYVSIAGITGTASAETTAIDAAVKRLRKKTDLPIAVGFGIKTPDQAAAVARVADAAVVGSAIVDRIADGIGEDGGADSKLATNVLEFVRDLGAAVRTARHETVEDVNR